ncbi:MAG: CoA transferase [Dehalococcoidales bacterium]|nr:CoA transferase [Dehalococcoidales bacterium]
MPEKALAGIKVLEWANSISGPYCTKVMADLGAEVIKIEEPGFGDEARQHGPFLNNVANPETSGLFLALNTNKMGITLNLKTPTGRQIFEKLIEQADIFVENYPPQEVKDSGLDYDHLKEINSQIIMTSITPFGQMGPYKDYKAYDINTSAAGGVSVGIGEPDREPLVMPASQGAYLAGISAAVGSLFALLGRELVGEGQLVDVSEAEVWANVVTGLSIITYIYRGVTGIRQGTRTGYAYYPSGTFACKDGYMCLTAPQQAQWERFLELMGKPEWAKDPRYTSRRRMNEDIADECDKLIKPWLMDRTKDEIFALCREKRIPFAPLRTVDELLKDPQLIAREFFVEVDRKETGTIKYPGAPFKMSKTPWAVEHAAPLLGEHNEEVYVNRLGYTKEELTTLRRTGVI